MLSEFIQQLLAKVSSTSIWEQYDLRLSYFLSIPAMVLVLWRIWMFTISPALNPREPKETPYWIPILGHALDLFTDFGGTLARGRKYFGTKAYKITICGQKLYILTSPQDISKTYKNSEALTFDDFMRNMLLKLGASPAAVEVWIPSSGADITSYVHGNSISPHGDFGHLGERLCRQQLLPGKEFEVLQATLITNIHHSLHWHRMSERMIVPTTGNRRTVSLLKWCREVLLDTATRAFFDERLMQIDPDLFESFFIFDEVSWKLHFGYPEFMSKKMYVAKDRIIDALTTYFRLPQSQRKGECWLIGQLETEMRQLGIGDRDIAAIIMPLYWVINANAYKSCFWTMAYILFDPTLLAALRAEIDPVMRAGTVNLEARLERCFLLEAVYLESLRLTSSSGTVRNVRQTTDIGDVTLKRGTNIVIPYRELHYNEDVFGENPELFQPGRFLNNKELKRSPSFKPFGGGMTYCPGRFLARREVMVFVADLIYRFDVALAPGRTMSKGKAGIQAPGQRFPRMNTKKIALALMDPVVGDDLLVDVGVRTG